MAHRELELDDETDRLLAEIANRYQGDVSRALADLIHAHEALETFVDGCEQAHSDSLDEQVERAEAGFRQGRFITWDEMKRRNGL